MQTYEICVNGTAYTIKIDENTLAISAEISTKAQKLKKRHKSYVKWLKRIKAIK